MEEGRRSKKLKKEGEYEEISIRQSSGKIPIPEVSSCTSGIGILPDDCLMEIFQHLPTVGDKIRIGRVCKRWQNLSCRHMWRNFKTLDMTFDTWGPIKRYRYPKLLFLKTKNVGIVDSDILSRIGSLCARSLTRISLPVEAFSKICPWTQNIRELALFNCFDGRNCQCQDAWPKVVKSLLPQCKNIRKIHFSLGFRIVVGKDMKKLFANMKSLKSINMVYGSRSLSTGHCFRNLSFEKIEEIVLVHSPLPNFVNGRLFSSKIRECRNLTKVALDDIDTPAALGNIFEALTCQAESLKSLSLEIPAQGHQNNFSPRLLENFSRLENLEKLLILQDLSHYISDTFLATIVSSCKELTHLSLRAKFLDDPTHSDLSDIEVSSFVNLPSLKFLNLRSWPIRKPKLERLRNLEILDVSECRYLEEKTLCALLRKTRKLRVILVDRCTNITERLLKAVVKMFKRRKSGTVLEIVLSKNYRVSEEFLTKFPDSLILYFGRNDPRFSRSIYWVESEQESKWKEKEVSYIENKSVDQRFYL